MWPRLLAALPTCQLGTCFEPSLTSVNALTSSFVPYDSCRILKRREDARQALRLLTLRLGSGQALHTALRDGGCRKPGAESESMLVVLPFLDRSPNDLQGDARADKCPTLSRMANAPS